MKRRITLVLAVTACCLALLTSAPSGTFSILSGLPGLRSLALRVVNAFTPPSTGAKVCGVVSAYWPATANAAGAIKIGNLTYKIAAGTALKGVSVGSDQCFTFCFDASGQINRQDNEPVAGQNSSQICGIVTSFSPSLGGVTGSITIGGAKIRIAPGLRLPGQDQVAPGSNTCLVAVGSGDLADIGSRFYQGDSPKQVRIAQIVHGRIFGPDNQDDAFLLPEPMILSLDSDQASVFTVGSQTFGREVAVQAAKIEGFSFSTPNASVQAVACTESLWDGELQIASNGVTNGDMVTLNLLNADKSLSQQIAMFSVENGGAVVTKLHPDVKMKAGNMDTKG
ncbi:MAG: hypothetical protein ACRD82_19845, partial [Blastocatellia bacterium]